MNFRSLAAVFFCLTLSFSLRAAEPAKPTGSVDRTSEAEKARRFAKEEEKINPKQGSNLVQPQPRVLHYNAETDTFVYIDSRTGQHTQIRPGGSPAYYGTRLNQFRFHGPAHRGGLYADLDDYKEQMRFEPEKYQYRFGNYSRNGDR